MSKFNEIFKRFRILTKSSNLDERYGTYASIEDANSLIPIEVRQPGLTVGIKDANDLVVEYWYSGGITDNDLVEKTAAGGELEENVNTTVEVGASEANSVIPEGTTFTEYVKLVHQKLFTPTFQNPSFSLSISGSNLRIIGSSTTFNVTVNFNRGAIRGDLNSSNEWESNLFQNPRAGTANNYLIEGVNTTSNSRTITEIVTQGTNSFTGNVSYDIGPQPKDSTGANYLSPYPAGTSPTKSNSFEGVYPLYASISTITTASQLQLYSMQNANNINIDLVAESGGNKQFFEIPNAWLTNRPLSSIQYFNTVSGSFDNTNQIGNFATSNTTKTIEGQVINYTKYTHTGSNRGSILIRLIF